MSTSSPVIGFGLDMQYAMDYPFNMAGLCQRYFDRLTHLSIVGVRSERQAQWFTKQCAKGLPVVHHLSNVAPGDHDGPHLDHMRALDELTKRLGALWTCEDIGIWSIGPYGIPYFAPPFFEEEIADVVADGIRAMQQINSVPFLAETPTCSFIAGGMNIGDFFHRLVERSGCKVVLDVGHVYSYALYRGEEPAAVLRSLPLDAVWEMHVAGAKISERYAYRYIDTHSDPILPGVEELLLLAATECRELRCVTYEIGNKLGAELLEDEVSRLERSLRGVGWRPRIQTALAA